MPRKAAEAHRGADRDAGEWIKAGRAVARATTAAATRPPREDDHGRAARVLVVSAAPSPAVPAPSRTDWAKTDIDRFILARLEQAGLAPVGAADKLTLIRRATLDLTGLPPTLEEIEAFEKRHGARRLCQSRRSPAGVAALRRSLGPPVARRRALWRRRSAQPGPEGPRLRAVSERVSLSRLGHQGLQRRPALRPVRQGAARRRSARRAGRARGCCRRSGSSASGPGTTTTARSRSRAPTSGTIASTWSRAGFSA